MPRLLVIITCLLSASVAQASPRHVVITGTRVVPERQVSRWVGKPPKRPNKRDGWGRVTVERVVRYYRERGYVLARAWHRVDGDGTVRIDIDEGRIDRVELVGGGSFARLLLSVDMHLPQGVLHARTLQEGLDRLKMLHGFGALSHHVVDAEGTDVTPLGLEVHRRILRIEVVASTARSSGLSVDVGPSAEWGLRAEVALDLPSLVGPQDHLRTALVIGLPQDRFLYDEDPSLEWVHGRFDIGYAAPPFTRTAVALRADAAIALSFRARADLGIGEVLALRAEGLGGVELTVSPVLRLVWKLGASHLHHFDPVAVAGMVPTPIAQGFTRAEARFSLVVERPGSGRTDLRSALEARADFSLGPDLETFGRLGVSGQWVLTRSGHHFIVRGRADALLGDVRFWDELRVGGEYHRVFLGSDLWVHHVAQLEIAHRFPIIRNAFWFGVFHDGSVFGDREQARAPVKWANAFGPSLHVLVFGTIAIDIFYAFGFSPGGFDHQPMLLVGTVD